MSRIFPYDMIAELFLAMGNQIRKLFRSAVLLLKHDTMSVKEAIMAEIISRAEKVITEQKEFPPEDKRTPQQLSIDRFFSTKRFCEHHSSAAELVGILTGYTPQARIAVNPPLFSVLYCSSSKCYWIRLTPEYGFASLENSRFHIDAGCERLTTPEEARAFLEVFKQVNPEKFVAWATTTMEQTKWMTEL